MGAIDPIIGYSQKITELTSKIKQCDDDVEDVYYSLYQDDEQAGLWDIMNEIAPDLFLSIDDRKTLAKDTLQSSTKVVY